MPLPKAPSKLGNFIIKSSRAIIDKNSEKPQSKKVLMNKNSEISDTKKATKQTTKKTESVKKGKSTSVFFGKRAINKTLTTFDKKDGKINKLEKNKRKKIFVLDTNVLMHDPTSLFRFQEHDIYIPMVTLEELDKHKSGMSEVSINVRHVTRCLNSLIGESSTNSQNDLNNGIKLCTLGHSDATGLLFFQTKKFEINLSFGLEKEKPDNEILSVVEELKKKLINKDVILVSKDINIRIKARALSLPAEDYRNDSVIEDDDLLYTGKKVFPDSVWAAQSKNIESWQHSGETLYRMSGSAVSDFHLNQFIFVDQSKPIMGIVEDVNTDCAIFRSIRDFSQTRNAVWGVRSRNPEQNFALNLLMTPEIDFVTLLGQAGTGKTLLALASGLTQTLESRIYNEIIITRATVPIGSDIGFLPGTEEEKMIPWMGAFEDNLEVLQSSLDTSGDWSRSTTADLINSRIKIKSLSFMRGRTFINKFLIIDEAQNLTPKEMKALITRAGPGTKIVCLGNVAQIDSPYLTESSSGLSYVVEKLKGWRHGGHITLQRGERSRLADFASENL